MGGLVAIPRDRIEHVIVLMMENRSFDHMLGYLEHNSQDFPNLERSPRSCPEDPRSAGSKRMSTSDEAHSALGVDPDHSHEAVMLQIFGEVGADGKGQPHMNGFIQSYATKISAGTMRKVNPVLRALNSAKVALESFWDRLGGKPKPGPATGADIMKCFSEETAPVISALAKEYAVLTNWHSSVPGETWPNRNFAHAATSDGAANIEARFYNNKTIFELLVEAGSDWRVYHEGVPQVWAFPRLWRTSREKFLQSSSLTSDIASDRLAPYSFVEPNHGIGPGEGNSQHPGNNLAIGDSFVAGEALMAQIYNALVGKPEVFAKTLLLIVYDEHGGFFDHVPPKPVPPPDSAIGSTGFKFDISGVRIPAVAISPLIPKGTIDSTFYEHSAIPRLLRAQFAPSADQLTERDGVAEDLLAKLPLRTEPRTDCARVDVPVSSPVAESAKPRELTEFEASLLKLAGAVKTRIEKPGLAESAEADGMPTPFTPDPILSAAAESRVLVPGSPADRAVDDVIAHFSTSSSGDIEFG